jgi:predicted nucleic acid-binding protein
VTAPLYILDTNILVHFVRASPVWTRVRDTYQPLTIEPQPIISVVSEGEVRSLALQWKWGTRKLEQIEFALTFFKVSTILDPDVIRAYAAIDAFCEENGQPLGKNDVWIAATAMVRRATLLTTDRDFDRLTPRFISRHWIDPDTTTSAP